MLLDFQGEELLPARGREFDREGLVDRRDGVLRELDVNDGADDLDDFAGVHLKEGLGAVGGAGGRTSFQYSRRARRSASASIT